MVLVPKTDSVPQSTQSLRDNPSHRISSFSPGVAGRHAALSEKARNKKSARGSQSQERTLRGPQLLPRAELPAPRNLGDNG